MAWLVGIDEAGYGPNLGPLVMTAIACRLPEPSADADLWQLLCNGVRRHGERDDGRLIVADSKLVYAGARGLTHLEKSVLAFLKNSPHWPDDVPLFLDLEALVRAVAPAAMTDLGDEAWYTGSTVLPMECETGQLHAALSQLRAACQDASVCIQFVRSVVICAPRFNELTDTCDSKAAALAYGFTELVRACIGKTSAEPTAFVIDKHGGRNQYGAMLRSAFPACRVQAVVEGMERSEYAVEGLDRSARLTFTPRADMSCFPVALASMVSKYLREALMAEFNAFWQRHVPGLKPTAGYPVDAGRFFAEIRSMCAALGINERQVWRRK
jgi:ribonuclease HII